MQTLGHGHGTEEVSFLFFPFLFLSFLVFLLLIHHTRTVESHDTITIYCIRLITLVCNQVLIWIR